MGGLTVSVDPQFPLLIGKLYTGSVAVNALMLTKLQDLHLYYKINIHAFHKICDICLECQVNKKRKCAQGRLTVLS